MIRRTSNAGRKLPTVIFVVILCIAAHASLAACISTQNLPGSAAAGDDSAGASGRTIGISVEQLVAGQTTDGREATDDPVNGHIVTVHLSQRMSVLAEGDERDLSRFSISLSTYGDPTEQGQSWLHAFGVVTNAYRVRDASAASNVRSWFFPFFRQVLAGLDDPSVNVTSRTAERGDFKVTAVAMRRPPVVFACFEPPEGSASP